MPRGKFKVITVSKEVYDVLRSLADKETQKTGIKVSINDVLKKILKDRLIKVEAI